MLVRILSAVLLFPILFILVALGDIYLKLGTMFVSLIGLYEFYKATHKKIRILHILGFLLTIIYLTILKTPLIKYFDITIIMFVFIFLSLTVIQNKKIDIYDISLTLFGFFYITFMFSTIYLIRSFENGFIMVWIPFICAWTCDTGAYFIGKAFGKHKISSLSPKKTVEGAIGGVLFSMIFCGLYGYIIAISSFNIRALFMEKWTYVLLFSFIGFAGSILAQLGDLAASAIKRRFDIKDYGKIIPGHGGILDRFDSVIFTAGVTYVIIKLLAA